MVDWTVITVIIFYQLFDSHSDGTHSLQSIHCWESDVKLYFSESDHETIAWGLVHFHQTDIFQWTIPLKCLGDDTEDLTISSNWKTTQEEQKRHDMI